MKILQIIPSISLVYGGPSQMILGLSKALAKEGEDVTIITTNANGDQGQFPLDVPLQCAVEKDGYRVVYFNCAPFRRYKFSVDLLRWLWTHCGDYDVAHIHALFSPVTTMAAWICRQKGLPYILRPLGTLDPKDLQKKRGLKKIYGNLLEKANLRGSFGVHFTSQQEADVSEDFGAGINRLIVPLGVEIPDRTLDDDMIYDRYQIPRGKPLLLFMSRIEPKKGLQFLIPALQRLLNQGYDFHFVLAGANPQDRSYEAQIQTQITSSSLSDCTTITGFVTGDEKMALLQKADLFLLPSFYENFGIAVVEAIAFSTPVLISDQVYIYREIEKAKAGWICSLNEDDLVKKLMVALESGEEERQQRGLNGFNLVKQNYSWSAIARQLIEIYTKAIKNN
ncbi:glycosyltransferase [Cyanobacterium stanieri LEGE 03274]|uniref:Glycosyltransferase n=1 Tax=Cyanobacterium stanieri LEGE 03274 TaxID=1828756 RepID=A0ABR9V238_9CHRO|nr:hormogonium polysaccharide biosynthesis glycosyltransferase HpsP [Cyanobacterium stanieri]MBE9221917.1 glycosyltransferase [Cyanobacterium stanieri LEGE 03274]